MKVTPYEHTWEVGAQIDPFFNEESVLPQKTENVIRVYVERFDEQEKWNAAVINCAATGDMNQSQAQELGKALSFAAGYAIGLDQTYLKKERSQ